MTNHARADNYSINLIYFTGHLHTMMNSDDERDWSFKYGPSNLTNKVKSIYWTGEKRIFLALVKKGENLQTS